MEQSRMDFQFNQHSGKILPSIEHDYTKLIQHKKLKVDYGYKMHLFGHSEEYYCLEMKNHIFPMKILIKNVKNEGIRWVIQAQYSSVTTRSTQV